MDRWVLALDIGTSSARAIVFDSQGRAVPGLRHQESYSPDSDEPGQATFDPDFLCERVEACIDSVLQAAGVDVGRVAAVGVTTFWHSMVGVDGTGQAVTPIYTWADTRCGDAAERLKRWIEPHEYHARTGCVIHPSYFPARLVWLRETEPSLFHGAARWISPGELLYQRFFGDSWCSVSMASGTGLFDQRKLRWDSETMAALGIEQDRLGAIRDPLPHSEFDVEQRSLLAASGLTKAYAARWPALARVPWMPAIGDGAASNVGSGCVDDRRIAINLGTSGAIRVCFRAGGYIEIPEDLWCYRLDRNRYVMGGAFSDGGDLAVWMRNTLCLPDWKASLERVAEMEPASHGLTVLPFLAGERSIGWRPNARATIHGLSNDTTPDQILRAGMEAVALRFALVYSRLEAQFPDAGTIVAAGGGFKQAPFWAQILADALGVPVDLSQETEATSRGAAAVALRAAGVISDESELPAPPTQRIEADPARHSVYRSALARQQALYEALLRL